MHIPTIWKRYLTGYFILDVMSSFPISFMSIENSINQKINASALQSAKFIRLMRMTRYLRLLRMVRFIKVSKLMANFEFLIVSEFAHIVTRFLNLCLVVIFIAHWLACVLYSITEYEDDDEVNWLHLQNL